MDKTPPLAALLQFTGDFSSAISLLEAGRLSACAKLSKCLRTLAAVSAAINASWSSARGRRNFPPLGAGRLTAWAKLSKCLRTSAAVSAEILLGLWLVGVEIFRRRTHAPMVAEPERRSLINARTQRTMRSAGVSGGLREGFHCGAVVRDQLA